MIATAPFLILTLACFFLAVLLIAFLKTPEMNFRFSPLLPLILPSWKFFDRPGHVPRLYFRLHFSDTATTSDWHPVLRPTKRGWSSLFLNAQGNLYLACQSLVEQLVQEIQSTPETQMDTISETITYQLIQNLVRSKVFNSSTSPNLSSLFQFKIVIDEEDFLISPLYGP